MFDRFLIYARARRALRLGQFEAALGFAGDPLIAGDRRAGQLRRKALSGLLRRGRRRLAEDNFDAAHIDVERVCTAAPEFDGAETLRAEIRSGLAAREAAVKMAQDLRKEARHQAERGDLGAAERLCVEAGAIQPGAVDQAAIERLIEGRKQSVVDGIASARRAAKDRDVRGLRRSLALLQGESKHGTGIEPAELEDLISKATQWTAAEFVERLREEPVDPTCLDDLMRDRGVLSDLPNEAALAQRLDQLAARISGDVSRALQAGELETAVELFERTHPLLRERKRLQEMNPGIARVREATEARARGDLGCALDATKLAAAELKSRPLAVAVDELTAAEATASVALQASRELAADGRLLAAREGLMRVLEDWPMHEPVRRQMEILNQQSMERDARLRRARELDSEARLDAAAALLIGLSGDDAEGREARMLLKDINRRMDLAAEGVAQVRRAVHGPASSREGLRHCVARLDEVAKLQADLKEVEALRSAIQAEIQGLEHLAAVTSQASSQANARPKDSIATIATEIVGFESIRSKMLRPDRLDARFLDVAETLLANAEAAAQRARLREATEWLDALGATLAPQVLQSRIDALRAAITSGQERARRVIEKIQSCAGSGSLQDSSELIEEARGIWVDCPELERLEQRVVAMHGHADAVGEVERLTGAGDVRGAQRKLHDLPPTPQFLRTRIFDIKQGLAQAQGLEQGFILRVDEGGEYLVLRDDSITIGNVRDGKADLQLLANIAGLHARIRRTMSFHGGMEDRIVAENGDVFVNDEAVQSAKLRSGDRVRLGRALEFVYRVPGKRSLSAALQLSSGFQVAGTDKILLLKDRGRDGRILIGRADDVHIRVPHDGPEVEIHGSNDGQIRVRFAGQGEMNGRPFRGAEPITAGALVRCGTTALVLQPWQRNG